MLKGDHLAVFFFRVRLCVKEKHIPLDVTLHIFTYLQLADLARVAILGKAMRALYKERLKEREASIEARLAQDWPLWVKEGLSAANMAVPRDLIDTPPVRHLCVVSGQAIVVCWGQTFQIFGGI
jgi:hypothetical protein